MPFRVLSKVPTITEIRVRLSTRPKHTAYILSTTKEHAECYFKLEKEDLRLSEVIVWRGFTFITHLWYAVLILGSM